MVFNAKIIKLSEKFRYLDKYNLIFRTYLLNLKIK